MKAKKGKVKKPSYKKGGNVRPMSVDAERAYSSNKKRKTKSKGY